MFKIIKKKNYRQIKFFKNKIVGITGINGSLGKSLGKSLKLRGSYVIGFSHINSSKKNFNNNIDYKDYADENIFWECGKERFLKKAFSKIDILIINHGINLNGFQSDDYFLESIEVNSLSVLRLINLFENLKIGIKQDLSNCSEIWINTSESEVLPSLSMSYELSKRLIGQVVSYKRYLINKNKKKKVKLKKLILGSFRSKLNPIGIMDPDIVAERILNKIEKNENVIVTPFLPSYFLIPINEFLRNLYYSFITFINKKF